MGGFFGGGTKSTVVPGDARPTMPQNMQDFSEYVSGSTSHNLDTQRGLIDSGAAGMQYGARTAYNELPGILQQGPNEAGYAQRAGDISNTIADPLRDPYNVTASTGMPLRDIQGNLMEGQNDADLNQSIYSLGAGTNDVDLNRAINALGNAIRQLLLHPEWVFYRRRATSGTATPGQAGKGF
jgi:hypothetical protein